MPRFHPQQYRFRDASYGIVIDTGVPARLTGGVLQTERRVASSMRRRLGNVYNRALRFWPVKSGFSKSQFYFRGPKRVVGGVGVEIGVDAWYAGMIPSQPHRRLLFTPVEGAATDRLLRDIGDELAGV